ncbi:hypothetical protein PUN28_014913 [Cardiocondyla obscurior]|uniref:Uncharacterized protein n=1 Tax=Cardiocondyla obscurior TaxID=286306 RepID=A0AAW2EYC5_9HYME
MEAQWLVSEIYEKKKKKNNNNKKKERKKWPYKNIYVHSRGKLELNQHADQRKLKKKRKKKKIAIGSFRHEILTSDREHFPRGFLTSASTSLNFPPLPLPPLGFDGNGTFLSSSMTNEGKSCNTQHFRFDDISALFYLATYRSYRANLEARLVRASHRDCNGEPEKGHPAPPFLRANRARGGARDRESKVKSADLEARGYAELFKTIRALRRGANDRARPAAVKARLYRNKNILTRVRRQCTRVTSTYEVPRRTTSSVSYFALAFALLAVRRARVGCAFRKSGRSLRNALSSVRHACRHHNIPSSCPSPALFFPAVTRFLHYRVASVEYQH